MGNTWRVNQQLYADDTVLIGESEENLRELLKEFNSVCKKRKLKVNAGEIR